MSFNDFHFNQHIINAVQQCGFTAPTPIQQQAIAPVLEGRDLLGLAQTGTGKTAAFILPVVQRLLESSGQGLRVLIVAPTRELAEQINVFTREIIKGTRLRSVVVYGGVSKHMQVGAIRAGVDIVIACPGRLLDILQDKAMNLSQVQTLILDEADHMFDKGFLPDIKRILRQLPVKRQTLVFSATMPDEIRRLTADILQNPVVVQIDHGQSAQGVSHHLYTIDQGRKTDLLLHILGTEETSTTLVFTRTKFKAKNLARKLVESGFKATSLQGNLSQNRRQQALDGFKSGTFNILVATDIAARGIDVTGISHVINFDVPDTVEAYIHRTGRTGRASLTGDALTFATADDGRMIRDIEKTLQARMSLRVVSEFAASKRAFTDAGPSGEKSKRSTPAPGRSSVAHEQNRRGKKPSPGVFGMSRRTR